MAPAIRAQDGLDEVARLRPIPKHIPNGDRPSALAPGTPGVRVAVDDLVTALDLLEAVTTSPAIVHTGPAGLEVTTQVGSIWETAVVPFDAAATDGAVAATAGVGALRSSLAASAGSVAICSIAGRLRVGEVDLQPAPRVSGRLVAAPPRPSGGPAAVIRVHLPPGLPSGLALRLDSVNLVVPELLRSRLAQRRCSLTTLYEREGRWLLSAICDGPVMLAIVGEVAVF